MTEVLSIQQPDGNTHFGSSLRRSSSHTTFLQNSPSYSRSSPNLARYAAVGYDTTRIPASIPSSAPSSPLLTAPDLSNQPSYTSTPSSSLSLEEQCKTEEEDIIFPSYDDGGCFNGMEDSEPHSSLEPSTPDVVRQSTSDTSLAKPNHPKISERQTTAGDDSNLKSEPTRHVDYLSHSWKEEHIWSSWRHIVAKRKVYSNWPRLENASWRTWTKFKYQLKTVSPETLNWMKDHDVTWLYGPLQTGNAMPFGLDHTPPASRLSRSNSFASKKPILKKRSLSEIMLQRSLSSSTLMKQATDALQAQHGQRLHERPLLDGRRLSDFVVSSETGTPLTITTTSTSTTSPSAMASGIHTPCTTRRIHFNNKVEQCIAINKEVDDRPEYYNAIEDDNDSSEDDMLIMRPVKYPTKARIGSTPATPRNSFSNESKTIAMLPSTTLNYRGDTLEPAEQKSRQKEKLWNGGSKLSPSPSQQTLKPSFPSTNFLLDDEDEDADMNWQPSAFSGPRDSVHSRGGLEMNTFDEEDGAEHSGMRRTPSGMFMPYEDEDDSANAGIFGKVFDTVNTAKDIAHVIWNVGWHR